MRKKWKSSTRGLAKLGDDEVREYINNIVSKAPAHLLTIISEAVGAFLGRLNIADEEVEAFIGQVKERKMGELFANFKGWDVQALRREAKEEARKAREEAKETGIEKLVKALKAAVDSKETTMQQLMLQYEISEEEAAAKIEQYWRS